MSSNNPAIQQFLNAWVAELGRAIEMFTGQQPALGFSMTESVSIPKTTPALWLKQVFSAESEFQVWIGAQDASWMELGKSLGDGPVESVRSTYLEIINQAQQGAATVTSLGLPTPIRCGASETLTSARFDPAAFFICDLELIDTEHPPLVIAIEHTALKVLDAAPLRETEEEQVGLAVRRVAPTDLR